MTKQNIRMRTLVAGFIAGLVLCAVHVPVTHAADDIKESIALSPTNKNYTLDAGQRINDTITIINDGEKAYTFNVYAEPYSVTDESYDPDFFTVRKNTDFKDWVTFEKSSYVLQPGQSVKVPFEVVVPQNATPGGHYGVLFAETQPTPTPGGGATLDRKKRVGALVYATVNGDFQVGGKFTGIRTPFLQFKTPLKSELNLENTGNSDFAVKTVFAVSDIFGNRKYTSEKEYRMLPQTKRKIVLHWEKSPSFGIYEVTTSAKLLDQQTTKTSYVLLAPLSYYMIFVIGLLVAVIYFVAKRR